MRKPTIAEKRAREVWHLASFKNPEPTEADIVEAKRFMNSFYRLCALSKDNSEYENIESCCNSGWLKLNEQKEMKWAERLDEQCQKTWGLRVHQIYSTHWDIGKLDGTAFQPMIGLYFY